MIKKRVLCLVLLMGLLGGCGAPASSGADSGQESQTAAETSQTNGEAQELTVTEGEAQGLFQKESYGTLTDITGLVSAEGKYYAAAGNTVYDITDGAETAVYSGDKPVCCFTVSGDAIYLIAGSGETVDGTYQEDYSFVVQTDGSAASTPLDAIEDYMGGGAAAIAVSGDQVFVALVDSVAVFDAAGNYQSCFQLENAPFLDQLCTGSSGTVYGAFFGTEFDVYDMTAGTAAFAVSGSDVSNGVLFAPTDGGELCLADGKGMLVYDGSGITRTALWSDSGISFLEIQGAAQTDSGYLILDSGSLYLISPASAGDVTPSTVLTIGVCGSTVLLEDAIARFNASNGTYQIETTDYSQEGDSFDAQLQALKLDLAAGDGPDLISVWGMSLSDVEQLGSKGYLADLKPLMEADTEFDAASVPVLSLMESGGQLYHVTDGFSIQTVLVSNERFSGKLGWTYDELREYQDAGETVFRYMSPDTFLTYSVYSGIRQFTDFAAADCSFDSEEFISLLELAARQEDTTELRSQDELDGIMSESYFVGTGEVLAANVRLDCFSDFAAAENAAGCSLMALGWPTLDGSGGSAIEAFNSYCVNASSQNQQGAWEFLKFLMTDPDYQAAVADQGMFPVSGEALSAAAEADVASGAADQEQVTYIQNLISQITVLYDADTIYSIVQEEAEALFAGDKTAAETAGLIQNRVKIYLAEQS